MVADEMMTFLGRRFLEKGSLWLFQASMAGMTELRLAPLAATPGNVKCRSSKSQRDHQAMYSSSL